MEASVMGVTQVGWSLTIAGTDRTAWIQKRTLRGDWSRNGFASLTFSTFDVQIGAAAYRPNVDQEVIFTVSGVRRFRGFIAEVGDTPLGGIRSGTRCAIKCSDASSLLDRVTVQEGHDYTGNPMPILVSLPEEAFTDIPDMPPGHIGVRLHAPHGWTTGTVVRIEGHTNPAPDASINGDHVITVPPHGPVGPEQDANYWIAATFYFPGTQTQTGGSGTARATFTTKAIISDLVTTYLTPNYGITLDPTMATGPIMEPFSLVGATINEALKGITGSMGWLYRMLPTNVLEVFAPGVKVAPFNLDGSNTHAPVQWQRSRQKFTNRIVLFAGGDQKVIATETFLAGPAGASNVYTMGYNASQDINDTWPNQVIVNGAITGPCGWGPQGLPDPSWYWDYAAKPARMVERTGVVPTPEGAVITVTYTRQFPLKVIAEDPVDVQPYPVGHGPWEELVEAPGVTDRGAAQAIANNLLAQKFKIIGPRELQTGTLAGYAYPGDAITLTFPDRTISGTWFVDGVAWSFWGKGVLFYEYTFVEGTSVTGNWITDFQQLLSTGGGGSAATTVLTGSGGVGGGSGGSGGATDLNYLGEYQSASYKDGDIVIAEDGIAYICVKQGVTTPPEPWSGIPFVAGNSGPVWVFLGGSRSFSAEPNPAAWVAVPEYVPFYSHANFTGNLYVEAWARFPNVGVTARLFNVTDGVEVAGSVTSTITSTVPVLTVLPITLLSNKTYRLQVRPTIDGEGVFAIGTIGD